MAPIRPTASVAASTMAPMARPSAMNLTSPVLPPMDPDHEQLVATARRELVSGRSAASADGPPLTDTVRRAEHAVVRCLERYTDHGSDDHLYVLEFQGWGQQYVMFGRTRSAWRRLAAHRQAVNPHGFALMDGWVSPGVDDAFPLEQIALGVAGLLHGQVHHRERFMTCPSILDCALRGRCSSSIGYTSCSDDVCGEADQSGTLQSRGNERRLRSCQGS